EQIKNLSVKPGEINPYLKERETSPIKQSVKLIEVLKRPQVSINSLLPWLPLLKTKVDGYGALKREVLESAEIMIKYAGYIEREKLMAEKIKRLEKVVIPSTINYNSILSLSTEARQKLTNIKPQTLGQASRINGVSPADISVLLVFLGR
ncbi:MAG: tRNA uridine-5-carboxymethylaminomethyl(34) synthesis enzyme MnmG, partial [Bacteroidales bacterium]|nr:tRNA uridine-5-carboxymethylaminomethyl(34) synthesis enzyme MnmG [Bacteroidales bacterium]